MGGHDGNSRVVDVFVDVDAHRFTADIIKRHSTNRTDIRKIALEGCNLSGYRSILELGCGFGFFTEALEGRVPDDAVVTGVDIITEYESLFLHVCRHAGVRGKFLSAEAAVIKEFDTQSADLAICSYSLYFFPELISEISRILHQDGLFIATVHNSGNMGELISFVRNTLAALNLVSHNDILPIEGYLNRCSSENGYNLLSPWFGEVEVRSYKNSLVFKPQDLYALLEYLRFKWPFFLNAKVDLGQVFDLFEIRLQQFLGHDSDCFVVSKDDAIFLCSKPLRDKGKP